MDEFVDSVGSVNSANQAALERNRNIRENYRINKKQFTNDVASQKAKVASFQTPETADVGEAVGSQIASKGKSLVLGAKTAKATAEGVLETGKSVAATFTTKVPVSKAIRIETAGGNLAKDSGLVTDLTKSLKSAASVGTTVAERAGSVGKLGLGATGLGVALGAKDVVDDIVQGKIEGNNAAEKVSNVSNIAAGALEGLGTALDLTGVAAPVGVALQAAGGLVGLFGAGADIAGEEEEKKQAQSKLQTLQKAPPVQEKLQAVQAGTAGEVKVN